MERMAMEQRRLSIGAVAEKLDVSPRAVSKWAAAGWLPTPVRIGRTVRWRASDIDRFVALGCRLRWYGRQSAHCTATA